MNILQSPVKFELSKAISVLEKTPGVLHALLGGLGDEWTRCREGLNTWSPADIVSHLVLGEKTDWIVRARMMWEGTPVKAFEPFDMSSHLSYSQVKSIDALLEEFGRLRSGNLFVLKSRGLTGAELGYTGIHPEFGTVTLRQHLASWVVHDLSHLAQIERVMAKQYAAEVGPWKKYLPLLSK